MSPKLSLDILLELLFIFGALDVTDTFTTICIPRKIFSVEKKADLMADQNQNRPNPQTPADNAPKPKNEQQRQQAETERANKAPGSQDKQPGAPGADNNNQK